ncbi:UPF0505 protein [Iris pallida]|uniref:UPF0505 protein n=1 Tax=Iris pallida TaxID=29817 RepID=A0AAX6FB90_IRIPA|nr:UPF0505 protein [Iris pallida]
MEFRPRDYQAEEYAAAAGLPRSPALRHPLSPALLPPAQADVVVEVQNVEFDDPLRAAPIKEETLDSSDSSNERDAAYSRRNHSKEWSLFTGSLIQKFSYGSTIHVSSALDSVTRSSREYGKSLADVHMEELEDPDVVSEAEKKVITRQEYVSRLQQLKSEIRQAWRGGDRVKALKLTIKVARLLMDTTVSQFYPTLFVHVIEVMDMLGDLVWERIKRKAEYSDEGRLVNSLPENFLSRDICSEAKDTCFNWFCKIGSIRELLPRIYLELAISRCWRFLEDDHLCNLERLTMMMRGLADPLGSAYCHLYMARCVGLLNQKDKGYLIRSIGQITNLLERIILMKEPYSSHSFKNKKTLITLMEPPIEWIMKCIFVDGYKEAGDLVAEFSFWQNTSESTVKIPCISVVLHYLLKQLPAGIISTHALHIIELFEQNVDISYDQHLNFRLLGQKLSESPPPLSSLNSILKHVNEVLAQYDRLEEYLIVADAHLDIILHHLIDDYIPAILDGIVKRVNNRSVDGNEIELLQSILVKLINHFDSLEDILSLNHFMDILEVLRGSSRNMVDMQILRKATRTHYISDPTTIQLLFEISQALNDSIDISYTNDDCQLKAHLITSFVQKVDFGAEREHHLTFLIECRAAFGRINELKDTLVHLSNSLAVKAVKSMTKCLNFLKACMAFNEVTIPSISSTARRMNLYIETAEVALLGGLVSHAEGLLTSAISCLECVSTTVEIHKLVDVDQISPLICKLCSVLLMIPGIPEEGKIDMPHNLISVVDCLSVISPRTKLKILCSVIYLSASLSQNKLPYHASNEEILGNDRLFYGDASYFEGLLSLSSIALQKLFDAIEQEPHLGIRGTMALEACNCMIICYKASEQLYTECSRLIEIAKQSLQPQNKFLEYTRRLFDKHLSTFR